MRYRCLEPSPGDEGQIPRISMRMPCRGTGLSEFKSLCRLLWTGRCLLSTALSTGLPCSWSLLRATGYSPSYMNYFLPSGCAISFYLDQLALTHSRFQIHIWFLYPYRIRLEYPWPPTLLSKRVHFCFWVRRRRGSFSIILPKVSCLFPFLRVESKLF